MGQVAGRWISGWWAPQRAGEQAVDHSLGGAGPGGPGSSRSLRPEPSDGLRTEETNTPAHVLLPPPVSTRRPALHPLHPSTASRSQACTAPAPGAARQRPQPPAPSQAAGRAAPTRARGTPHQAASGRAVAVLTAVCPPPPPPSAGSSARAWPRAAVRVQEGVRPASPLCEEHRSGGLACLLPSLHGSS